MVSRNMTGYRMLLAAALSIIVFQVPAIAQLDEAERLVYLAKAIKRIVVKQIDTAQPQDESKAKVERSFECKAYDKDGKEVDISSDQASKLYKWTVKDSAGTAVDQKGVIEQLESAKDKTRKVQNVLKLVMDKGNKAVKLEMSLADEYSTYSSAVGKSSIAAGKGGVGMFRSIGRWIGRHPYWTAGGAVVVGGGIAAASGGGSSGDSGASGGGGSSGTTSSDQTASSDWILGTWVGSISGTSSGGGVTFVFSSGGSLSVGPSEGSGAGSYSVSGSSVSGSFDAGDHGPNGTSPLVITRFSAQLNGNTLSGSWSDSSGSGTLSVTKQ